MATPQWWSSGDTSYFYTRQKPGPFFVHKPLGLRHTHPFPSVSALGAHVARTLNQADSCVGWYIGYDKMTLFCCILLAGPPFNASNPGPLTLKEAQTLVRFTKVVHWHCTFFMANFTFLCRFLPFMPALPSRLNVQPYTGAADRAVPEKRRDRKSQEAEADCGAPSNYKGD